MLDAQRILASTKDQLAQVRLLSSSVDFAKALGGGWTAGKRETIPQ